MKEQVFVMAFCIEQWDFFPDKSYKMYIGVFWFCIIYALPGGWAVSLID